MKKKIVLALMLAGLTMSAQAEGYIGLYGVSQNTDMTGAELEYTTNPLAMVFGVKTDGQFAIGTELLLINESVGASIGVHATAGDVTLSAGKMAIPDTSIGSTCFGAVTDKSMENATYLAAQYKMLSIRFVEYDADNTYTGYSGRYTSTTTSHSRRRQVWAGLQFAF